MTNDNSLEINKRLQEEIESRQLAEEALRQSREQYRSVVESQPALICRYAVNTLALTFVSYPSSTDTNAYFGVTVSHTRVNVDVTAGSASPNYR